MENMKKQKLTEEMGKIVIVNKVKAGKYLSDEEMEKLERMFYEFDEILGDKPLELITKAEILKSIKEGKKLADDEVEELAYKSQHGGLFGDNLVEVIKRENQRWFRNMTTILEFNNEFYAIDWGEGLTEFQENCYWSDKAYKVRKTERVITITDYERIEEGENTK